MLRSSRENCRIISNLLQGLNDKQTMPGSSVYLGGDVERRVFVLSCQHQICKVNLQRTQKKSGLIQFSLWPFL